MAGKARFSKGRKGASQNNPLYHGRRRAPARGPRGGTPRGDVGINPPAPTTPGGRTTVPGAYGGAAAGARRQAAAQRAAAGGAGRGAGVGGGAAAAGARRQAAAQRRAATAMATPRGTAPPPRPGATGGTPRGRA